MDWNKEFEQINDMDKPLNWWNAPEGIHKIKLLSEGEEYMTKDIFHKAQDGSDINIVKVRFDIEFYGKKYSFSMAKGKTFQSLYGQLVKLGKKLGCLENKEITLIIKGNGTDKSYTVLEAIDDENIIKSESNNKKQNLFITN